MYWDEEEVDEGFSVPDDVVDLAFAIRCAALPVEHAYPLSREVIRSLPWFEGEPGAGLHLIHGAESGNGWERPSLDSELIYLSRRTRLVLRLPKERIDDARALEGRLLEVIGHGVEVGTMKVRLLSSSTTLYARHVALTDPGESEEAFLAGAVQELRAAGIRVKKLLCGKGHTLRRPEGPLVTRSLLVTELTPEDSVSLQQRGVGGYRTLGCGLFIPHKAV